LDSPLTATLCVPIGASLIIFSKIMWFLFFKKNKPQEKYKYLNKIDN
jgi:hypothetical protein